MMEAMGVSFSEPQSLDCERAAQSKDCGSVCSFLPTPYSFLLSSSIRLSFWFACFWAVVGVVWRPPLASVGLIALFLVLLVAIEWASRRLITRPSIAEEWSECEDAEPMEDNIQQQIVRTKTPEGLDRLEGTFLVEFPADTLTATVHIPFCPAFERVPKVQAFPVDESDVNLRIASPKAFGVRVDVKRSNLQGNLEGDRLRFAVIAEG